MRKRTKIVTVAIAATMLIIIAGAWYCTTPEGKDWLGYISGGRIVPHKPADPIQSSADAFNSGDFKKAESEALDVIRKYQHNKDAQKRKNAARARYILAFSAARQKNLKLARERFAELETEAARLPDKGAQPPSPNEVTPTLEQEAAYQHAVCTAALGDKKAAEAEYMRFIESFPDSPLTGAAAERIRMLNGGKMPQEAEKAWEKSNATATAKIQKENRELRISQAMCAPECLTELLRRQGKAVSPKELAKEMKTSEYGTTLANLADIAEKHGCKPTGYDLTLKGLTEQPLPAIVLIRPQHYVIVEKASLKGVKIWDPYGKGFNEPGYRKIPAKDWEKIWTGITLVLEDKKT